MKFNITVDEGIDPLEAMWGVMQVIKQGRISETMHGSSYCFVTTFKNGGVVYADRTKTGIDTFRVSKHEPVNGKE